MRKVEIEGSENKKKNEFPANAKEAEILGPWFMLSGNLDKMCVYVKIYVL